MSIDTTSASVYLYNLDQQFLCVAASISPLKENLTLHAIAILLFPPLKEKNDYKLWIAMLTLLTTKLLILVIF